MNKLFLFSLIFISNTFASDKIYDEGYKLFMSINKVRENNPSTLYSAEKLNRCYSDFFKNDYLKYEKSKDSERAEANAKCNALYYPKSKMDQLSQFKHGYVFYFESFLKYFNRKGSRDAIEQNALKLFNTAMINVGINDLTNFEMYHSGCSWSYKALVYSFENQKEKYPAEWEALKKHNVETNTDWCKYKF